MYKALASRPARDGTESSQRGLGDHILEVGSDLSSKGIKCVSASSPCSPIQHSAPCCPIPHLLPVDNIPEGSNVLGPPVLVLQVVGVLVAARNTKQRTC